MSYFQQAITELIERVKDAKDEATRLVQVLEYKPDFAFIDWLQAQPLFPKFYWQSRDTREEVVALGQLKTFKEPAPAYAYLSGSQRIWGGRSFDGQSAKNPHCPASFFFLPQVELVREEHTWSLVANIVAGSKSCVIKSLQQLRCEVPRLLPLSAHIDHIEHTPTQPEWNRLVEKVLQGIDADEYKKVVLARRTTLGLHSPICAAQLLKSSSEHNQHSFHFMLAQNDRHSFLGSTPERLYYREGKDLYTEALAGTIGRGDNATHDMALANWLTQDSKNLNENQYVVDDIIDRLTPYSDLVEVEPEARLVRLRKVQHLKRSIHAHLNDGVNGVQLLGALQPTAAVAGLPRRESMDFIQQHEPFERSWYAGSMGFISLQRAEFCVAIRSAQVVDDEISLYAGAGIVPGSVAEHEWQELDKKMATLLSLISDQPPLGVAS
ncbi:isochorismate synthase [Vibrio panuliri]|uniref:Isochorismate synthase MenF n=1 Tax=Vibrio panuliri TaxID=1381081 RepID=A0ABX3F756_9VIBR|nr:isochorismate synthase [Vibrio panuliri]KAB1454001.1 isochorismate synthase [Vibrio panuliri]OLQ84415.1 isochorismate synthase [Vibrio panuliri]